MLQADAAARGEEVGELRLCLELIPALNPLPPPAVQSAPDGLRPQGVCPPLWGPHQLGPHPSPDLGRAPRPSVQGPKSAP